ncbi:MAG: hypothetical protein L0Y55_07255 [Anaerolineales bacterium]|nr:hypothetical protein [Anaerolineales bacterium]
MKIREIQERYMQDELPIRLGGLAADLARIVSFSKNHGSAPVVASLLDESSYFVEWSAPDLLPDRVDDAARLVDIQRGLTRWYRIWGDAQNDPAQRAQLAAQARAWSDEILQMSGLLDQE